MTRLVLAVMALGLLAAATPSSAACRWFGTQLECDLGGNQVLIGTQTEDEPAYLRPFRPAGLYGGGALLPGPGSTRSALPVRAAERQAPSQPPPGDRGRGLRLLKVDHPVVRNSARMP